MNKDFEYRAIDEEGMETLSVIEQADKFNEWMYRTIRPWCQGKILEIGSGIGNISQFFINENAEITLSDIRDNYCEILTKKFAQHHTPVININLTDPEFDGKFAHLFGNFDAVFALNVVEHINDDSLALSNCYKLLRPGGRVVILVPAYQALYNSFDKALEHYRRYTKSTLSSVITGSDFRIIHRQYFNAAGIAGWFVSGYLQKNDTIPGGQMKLYNKLVPVFKLVDKCLFNQFGLSVIVVGEKPA